jgi:iron-sulfur cluster repair protein YtfE (RIC family)
VTEPTDVIDLLLEDHRVVRGLLAELDAADQPEDLRRLYLRIVELHGGHEAAEEDVVFPALRRAAPAAANAALARMGEHEELDQLLEEMRRLAPSGHGFAKRAVALVLELTAHLDAEEQIVFPLLRQSLTPERRAALAVASVLAKDRAPAYREHPAAV